MKEIYCALFLIYITSATHACQQRPPLTNKELKLVEKINFLHSKCNYLNKLLKRKDLVPNFEDKKKISETITLEEYSAELNYRIGKIEPYAKSLKEEWERAKKNKEKQRLKQKKIRNSWAYKHCFCCYAKHAIKPQQKKVESSSDSDSDSSGESSL